MGAKLCPTCEEIAKKIPPRAIEEVARGDDGLYHIVIKKGWYQRTGDVEP